MPVPRPLLGHGTAGMVLAAALALASCSGDSGPASYDGPRDAERAIVNLTTEMASGGRRALRVEADSGFFQAGSGEVKLVGIHASMFSPDGVASVTIEADSAVLDDEAQRLTAMGEVLVRNRQGLSVETTELLFDASTSRLTSDSSTTVEEGGRTESGPCFESDSQLSQWRFCNGRQ